MKMKNFLAILLVCFAANTAFPIPIVSARFATKTVSLVIDVTPPTLSSTTISSNGTTVTLVFSEAVTRGAGYSTGNFDIDGTVSNNTLTYVSGDGTTTWVMTATSTVLSGETPNIDFSGTANSVEDSSGNDLAAIVDGSVSNGSTASGYLLQEDFTGGSGTTPPSGWTNDGGTWSYSNTSPALQQGGNNAVGNGGAGFQTWKAFTAQSECWAHFEFRTSSIATGSTKVFSLEDSSGVDQLFVRIAADGTVQIWDGFSEATATTGSMVVNTNYYVWVHYKAGTGANGVLDVAFSTSSTRPVTGPANYIQLTGASATANVARIAMYLKDDNSNQYFDHILVSSTQIGDNP